MLKGWGSNMVSCFIPGWANCLDKSMSIWTNKFLCPGFMFIPRKPWPFGNEYHMVCCCATGIMWVIDLVEGKDCPCQRGQQKYDDLGATVGLLLQLLAPIFFKGFIVILDSAFCVLKGIIELCKRVCLQVLSSKREDIGESSQEERRSSDILQIRMLEMLILGLECLMTSHFMFLP